MTIKVNPRALEDAAARLYMTDWFPNSRAEWPTWADVPEDKRRLLTGPLADFLRIYDEAKELDLLRRRAGAKALGLPAPEGALL